MTIPTSKEATIEAAAITQSEVMVFSKRLGQDRQIGAAAVLYRGRVEKKTLRKHMGSEENHTVFEAELISISLATELIKYERHEQMATIRADSQVAK